VTPFKVPIMLVDDDVKLLRVVTLRLQSEGYAVVAFSSAQDALAKLAKTNPGLVITDLKMPERDGVQFLSRLQEIRPGLPVVLFSAYADVSEAVRAVHAGAIDFLTKPIDWDHLLELLHRHLSTEETTDRSHPFSDTITTRSPMMLEVLNDAQRVANTTSAVLITGASGSGKEVLARALHNASSRNNRPFIALNCAAVPTELLESELFGHKRGAFTGAQYDHLGLFRAANSGTIFLDEIGDMPRDLQAKLLRVLEEREVRPVGEVRSVPIDVRIISATHHDLETSVENGDFRKDLFYRLNVIHLPLPSLEERCEDIPMLASERLAELTENGLQRHLLSPEATNLLVSAPWPGNIRQLFNVVERAAVLTPRRVISASVVRRCLGQVGAAGVTSFTEARDEFARRYLIQLLEASEGNVSQAARLAGRNRTNFYRLLSRYGLASSDFNQKSSSSSATAESGPPLLDER